MDDISKLVGEIALSAKEEATGIAEVNTAVNQMDQVTQQNAAMVEQTTAASRMLAGQSEELFGLVSRFQVGEAAAQESAAADDVAPAPPAARSAGAFRSAGNAAIAEDDWTEF